MNLKNRIYKSLGWNFFGTIISQVCSLGIVFILVRILSSIEYGKFSLVQSTALMFSNIAGAGLGITATKFIAENRESEKQKAGRIIAISYGITLILSIIFASALFLFSSQISINMFNDSSLAIQFKYASIYTMFFTINAYQVCALTGFENFNAIAKINIFRGSTTIILSTILTMLYGINGSCIAMVVTSFLLFLYSRYLLNNNIKEKNIKILYKGAMKESKILLKFTLPAAIGGIITALAIWDCNQILVNKSLHGYNNMAIFSIANNMKLIIIFIPNLIMKVISPILVNIKKNNKEKYRKMFKFNIFINIAIVTLISLLVLILSPIIIKVLGKSYQGINIVIAILSISVIFEVISQCLFQELYVNNKIWINLVIIFFWATIMISITNIFVIKLGALALSIAYLSGNIFYVLVYTFFLIFNRRKEKEYEFVICD